MSNKIIDKYKNGVHLTRNDWGSQSCIFMRKGEMIQSVNSEESYASLFIVHGYLLSMFCESERWAAYKEPTNLLSGIEALNAMNADSKLVVSDEAGRNYYGISKLGQLRRFKNNIDCYPCETFDIHKTYYACDDPSKDTSK